MAKGMDGQHVMEKDPKQFVHKDSLRGGKLRPEVKVEWWEWRGRSENFAGKKISQFV